MADFNEKSRTSYNKKADNYDSTFDGKFTRKFKDMLLSVISLTENCNVLDVACGNGSLLAALNKKTPIKGFGIDIAERMVENAAAANPGMEFYTAGCEAIPFNDETMDIITVCAAYHHFPDVAAFASEAKRVLKPKGMLYVADVYQPTFLRNIFNPFIPLSKAGDVKFYSPKEISENFKNRGFNETGVRVFENVQIIIMQKP